MDKIFVKTKKTPQARKFAGKVRRRQNLSEKMRRRQDFFD
jgi:hypothetical protein